MKCLNLIMSSVFSLPSTLPGSSALNKKTWKLHENIYFVFRVFVPPHWYQQQQQQQLIENPPYTTKKTRHRYWDPVYMSQNFEFAGAAPPGVGETWELVWKGRVEMSCTWGCCNGITYPDGMTFSGWVQTLNAVFRFFFGGKLQGRYCLLYLAYY